MATRDELYTALRNADAAGDTAGAQKLAAYIKSMPATTPAPTEQQGTGSKLLDTGNAIGTGFQKGLIRLAGLPVDTAANVLDLGKAAIGVPYREITGKMPPDFLQVGDRSNVVGSGDYMIKKARTAPVLNHLVNPINPAYEGGYAEATGGGLTGVINPNSLRQAVNQGVISVGGSLAGKGVYDATGNTALAIAAGMAPLGAQSAAIDLTKRAVRGGEQGRRQMEQRIQDLKDAGIDNPSVGLASGNNAIGSIENLLQQTPGAVGVMGRNRDAAIAGLEGKTLGAADAASTNRGSIASGTSIQKGSKAFKDGARTSTNALYDRLSQVIPDQFPVEVGSTRNALTALNADIPTMEALSRQFKNGRIQAIEGALNTDMAGTPAQTTFTTQRIVAGTNGAGMPVYKDVLIPQVTPAVPARTAIPFEAVKKTRTLVGNELNDNSLIADVPRSKWNPLYAALSDDMKVGATAAGPAAESALNRANNYTRSSINRLDRISPIADRLTPEDSFKALNSTLKDNVTTFQAVKKSLPENARGDFAGTVIERLGKAKPGQQNAEGDKWSPETFLTNWNGMSKKGQTELLSGFPNAAQVAEDISKVAKATEMMRSNSKMYGNPSGTGANLAARGTLGAIGVGVTAALSGLINPLVPLGAAGGVGSVVSGKGRGIIRQTDQQTDRQRQRELLSE